MGQQMTPNNLSNLEKEEQSQRDHNTCYHNTLQDYHNQNSLVLAQEQTHRSMEWNREHRNKLRSIIIQQSGQEHKME